MGTGEKRTAVQDVSSNLTGDRERRRSSQLVPWLRVRTEGGRILTGEKRRLGEGGCLAAFTKRERGKRASTNWSGVRSSLGKKRWGRRTKVREGNKGLKLHLGATSSLGK